MPEIARLIAVAEADTSQAERSLERLGQKFDQTVNRARDAQGRFVKMGDAARGAMPHIDQFGSKLGVANNSLERLTGRLGGGSLGLAAMTTGVGSLTAGLALGGAAVLGYSGRLEQARNVVFSCRRFTQVACRL